MTTYYYTSPSTSTASTASDGIGYLYNKKSIVGITLINSLIAGISGSIVINMFSSTEKNKHDDDMIKYGCLLILIWILLFTIIGMCFYSYGLSIDDEDESKKKKDTGFSIAFWGSIPIYIVTIFGAIIAMNIR